MKPTQGLTPHLAPSTMRSAGPIARTVDDLIDLYRIFTRPDVRHAWSLPYGDTADMHAPLTPAELRIGNMLDMGYGTTISDGVLRAVRRAATQLKAAGAVVTELPAIFGEDPYPTVLCAQVLANAALSGLRASRAFDVSGHREH